MNRYRDSNPGAVADAPSLLAFRGAGDSRVIVALAGLIAVMAHAIRANTSGHLTGSVLQGSSCR